MMPDIGQALAERFPASVGFANSIRLQIRQIYAGTEFVHPTTSCTARDGGSLADGGRTGSSGEDVAREDRRHHQVGTSTVWLIRRSTAGDCPIHAVSPVARSFDFRMVERGRFRRSPATYLLAISGTATRCTSVGLDARHELRAGDGCA
jgi:hypothetical protein